MEKLTKKQLEVIKGCLEDSIVNIDFIDRLKEQGLIDRSFKDGWYYNETGLVYFSTDKEGLYGFVNGVWSDSYFFDNRDLYAALDEEVEEVLTVEAKKRGFKVGVSYIGVSCKVKSTYTTVKKYKLVSGRSFAMFGKHFNSDNRTENFSEDSCGGLIFCDGEWAEVDAAKKEKQYITFDGKTYREV